MPASLLFLLALTTCGPRPASSGESIPETTAVLSTVAGTRSVAQQTTPYPYVLPLPEPTPTFLDGTYTKVEPATGPHVPCKRCPDYAPEGGLWELSLDRGVFRVSYPATGWQSSGSFVLSRESLASGAIDQIVLFNDPVCPRVVGLYTWKLEGSALTLHEIEDPCAIHLRAKTLTRQPWLGTGAP